MIKQRVDQVRVGEIKWWLLGAAVVCCLFVCGGFEVSLAADGTIVIPRRQDRPPGPAVNAAEAIKKMSVPKGFEVKTFADEPEVVNPTAMTFGPRGRLWICESVEYPRTSAGKGKDRIKILEDTDGDGKADKSSIFADGLNIPCGIALGNGGAYVSNAPDLLFLKDTNGDGKADQP